MKINKNTWHYKLWQKSFKYRESPPEETDLCRYCHRVFWQLFEIAVLVVMTVVAVVCVLALLVMGIYKGLWQNPVTSLLVLAGCAALVTFIYLYNKWLSGSPKPKQTTSLMGGWMAARKQNVCPLVEFDEEE